MIRETWPSTYFFKPQLLFDTVLYVDTTKARIDQIVSLHLESNLNSSNPDGLFTMADANLFFSPYEILPIASENI